MSLTHFRVAILSLFLFSFIHSGSAQVGALNKDFGNDGYIDINLSDTVYTGLFDGSGTITDVNGNMYLSGIFDGKKLLVFKLTPDGKPDLSFGNKGSLSVPAKLNQGNFGLNFLVQADSHENIYLLYSINNTSSVIKFNRFGQADLSFGTNGVFALPNNAGYAASFAIDTNNNLYYTGGVGDSYVVKFNADGILDNTFGTNGITFLKFGPYSVNPPPTTSDILIDAQGYLYISAVFPNQGGAIIKLNPNGSFANTFGTNGVLRLSTPYLPKQISFDSQERIYILDQSASSNQNSIFRYFTSGLPDFSFGQNGIFNITLDTYTQILLKKITIDTQDNIFISGSGILSTTSAECIILKINTTTMNFDPSFHSDGLLNFVSENGVTSIDNIVTNPAGTIFASGNTQLLSGSYLETLVINPTGTITGSISNQKQNINSADYISDACLNEQGNLYLSAMMVYGNSQTYPSIASITPDGNFNQNFGTKGKQVYPTNLNTTQDFIAIEKSGYIYSIGTYTNADPTQVQSFIIKTDPHGNRVNSFGTNGIFIYTATNNLFKNAFELLFDQDSSLLIFENHNNSNSIRITKISRSGAIDLSYGNQGSLLITNDAPLQGAKAIADNDGAIYICGHAGTNDIFITKIKNKVIDPAFGIDGFFFQTFTSYTACTAVSFDSDKNLVLASYYLNAFPNLYGTIISKITSYGERIPEFGSNGSVILPFQNMVAQDMILDKNDNIFLFASSYGSNFTVAKVTALGTVDASFGNNGLTVLSEGGYRGVVHDKAKGIAYLYGINYTNYNNDYRAQTDIRIFCLQIEKTDFNTITGTVFKDADVSCTKQPSETGINNMGIVAQPGNNYSITDASGSYTLKVDTGAYQYTVKQLMNPIQQQLYVNTCTDEFQVPLTGSEKYISDINFADKTNPQACPLLYIDVQNTVRRRCYPGVTKIKYANYGTASKSNVRIRITYPAHVEPKNSIPMWHSNVTNILTYNIGTLTPGQEGYITIADSVLCFNENILGLTQCVKAEILPIQNCPLSADWDQSEITISQTCASDSLSFYIKNTGTGDMDAQRNFYVFVNDTIVYYSPFLLESQKAVLIKYPANGKTIRVSAEQHPAFPFPSNPSVATQGCSSTTIVNPVHTPLTNLPLDDRSFHVAYSCLPIIGSFDPNHKSVTPSGYGTENYINKKDKLTYTIQFQNVGTDTAFKVVVIDTLDNNLNIETLLIESSSHPYTYTLSGRGVPVLKFSFDPIVLTDSTSNLIKSQGFISYSIYPKENLSEGMVINNKAYIYFDYNSPIITNETVLTIKNDYYQDLSKGSSIAVRTAVVTAIKTSSAKNILVYPNPAKDQLHIKSTNANLKSIQFTSLTGSVVLAEKLSGNESVIKINVLVPGIYFYTILDEQENSSQGKIIVE